MTIGGHLFSLLTMEIETAIFFPPRLYSSLLQVRYGGECLYPCLQLGVVYTGLVLWRLRKGKGETGLCFAPTSAVRFSRLALDPVDHLEASLLGLL